MQKIIIGSDHTGIELKNFLKNYLQNQNYEIIDVGSNDTNSCDYPDIAKNLALTIKKIPNSLGILICGTGIGMSISVNRYSFIRGAILYNNNTAVLAKEHNNANVAILGARTFSNEKNLEFLKTFLSSKFSEEERHKRRIEKIS